MRIKVSYNEDSNICKTTLHQADLSKRKGAKTEETVLTPKLKKFQLQYSTGSDFLRFFTVFFQIKKYCFGFNVNKCVLFESVTIPIYLSRNI